MTTRKTLAQVPVRNRGDKQCPHHDMEFMLACIDCGGDLVCSKCIISKHQRHSFEDISQVAANKKNNIQEYVQNVEKTQIPFITSNLQSVDQEIKKNTNHFKSLLKQITSQGEKMKEEIDRITKDLIDKCQEIEKQNCKLLSKYKNDLESLHTQLSRIIAECKDALKTASNIMIIDTEKDTQQAIKLPGLPNCRTPEFTAGPKSSKQLQDEFGCLSLKEGQMFVPQQSDHAPKSDVVKKYRSSDSTVVSEFEHSTCITSVVKSTPDSIWLSYEVDEYISLVTFDGKVKKELELPSNVHDISVSPVTGNLWLCCSDYGVYEAAGDKPTKRFTIPIHVRVFNIFVRRCISRLCVTPDNNVVISTSDQRITVYSTTGQALHSTHPVTTPYHITVCSSTGDIAVCNRYRVFYEGEDKSHVSVFNSKLDLRYQYYGPPASVMKSDFNPYDAVYDTQGHLLIADYNNKCIQLVSGEGQFLTVLHTDTLHPKALTLIQDGLLCVGFDKKKVEVIRYRV